MDAKLTLSFDKDVIAAGKALADKSGISLSRLLEHILRHATRRKYASIEDMPIADWVRELSEGPADYSPRKKRSKLKEEWALNHAKKTVK